MPTNNLKHVGQLVNTQRRCIVVFREVPDDIENCLVVDTDALPDWMHDDIIKAVESAPAQAESDFYEYAQRTVFTDGSAMLTKLHTARLLQKQPTTNVSMTPNRESSILLSDLNALIRQQQNGGKPPAPAKSAQDNASVAEDKTLGLSDDDIAKQLLTQAEQFEKEALALRESAYEMSPELKPRRGRPSKAKVEAQAQAEAEAEAES